MKISLSMVKTQVKDRILKKGIQNHIEKKEQLLNLLEMKLKTNQQFKNTLIILLNYKENNSFYMKRSQFKDQIYYAQLIGSLDNLQLRSMITCQKESLHSKNSAKKNSKSQKNEGQSQPEKVKPSNIQMKDNQVKCQPQLKEPWGKLVSMSSELNNILLIKNKYTFGKASDNDVNLCNDSIEGRHFELSQGEDGTNYICDLSSSGTFLEEKRLRKGVPEKIETGQRIQLGMKSKRKMENPIAFVFCELNQSQKNSLKVERTTFVEDSQQIVAPTKQQKLETDFGEELKCCICLDLIYQCYSSLPCLHNFCGCCLSGWLEAKKTACPQCRVEIQELKKNSTINNLVQKVLECKPELKKTPEEYKEMDRRNKLKGDNIKVSEENNINIETDDLFDITQIFPSNITRFVQISCPFLGGDMDPMYSQLINSMNQTVNALVNSFPLQQNSRMNTTRSIVRATNFNSWFY